ncbi:DgyrCDS11180 [Dimorphilus gyrociliatus]|uniref:DgyrCDS11180 n=1 Tax=Dimorphilus gyrociliatus TaxID=2664684 RepID=A0A7I8W4F8_9ANNE|nr:DgyrCDS11180 [Dimorphilus gyrociliatus]
MSFACQKDSYLTHLDSVVKSCTPSKIITLKEGKKIKLEGFDVILEDTVLFPEGGGQPDDHGKINGIEVHQVIRKGSEAIHFLKEPLKEGEKVDIQVDWKRRWDNMQQHSGQHLITAIADKIYGFKTTSWSMGEKISFIELDVPKIKEEELKIIEEETNSCIRKGLKMFPTWYESINDPKFQEVRTRGLPDDHKGSIRVVTIEGIDNNTCCGTHVSNLSHLQAIKLLSTTKGKKGKTNVYFLVGQRVLDFVEFSYSQQEKFKSYLKGSPEQHVELLEVLQKNYVTASKENSNLLKDIAKLEADKWKREPCKFLSLHRTEGQLDFMNTLLREIDDENLIAFLTTGNENGQGSYMIVGPESFLKDVAPSMSSLIEGKGFLKNNRFQGKANKLSKRKEAEDVLREKLK